MKIIRSAEKLAHLTRSMNDPHNFLIGRMFVSKSVDDLATVIYAYWLVFQEFSIDLPDNHNPIWEKSVKLVQYLFDNPDPIEAQDAAGGLNRTPAGMTTNYDIVPPSDAARKEMAEFRARHGLAYIGPRHVGLKPTGEFLLPITSCLIFGNFFILAN